MRRREFVAALFGTVAGPSLGRAQQRRLYRLGILETVSTALNAANLNAFKNGLRELGYLEGENLVIEYRSAEGRAERFPALAEELAALKVDLLVTRGTPAAIAASNLSGRIPVVMAAIGEPLNVGVVADLARPGGKVTGLSAFATTLAGKRVEILQELIPGMRQFIFLLNMGNPVMPPQWEQTRKISEILSLKAILVDARIREDINRVFERTESEKIDALIVGIDGLFQAHRDLIVALAAKHKVPTMYSSREFMEAGGLVAYGVSYPDLYYRAAGFVDKVLKGTNPTDMPVEQPVKFETIINLRTAKALGLKVPESFLVRADQVIE